MTRVSAMIEPTLPQCSRRLRNGLRPENLLGWLLLAVLVVGGAGRAPAQDEKLAKEYYHAFKDGPPNPSDLKKLGPDNEQCVKFEADGLRITLSKGVAGDRPGTGVTTAFGVRGDFEITARYDILQEPHPAQTDAPARFTMAVRLDKPQPDQFMAFLRRRLVPKDGSQYHTSLQLGPAAAGKKQGRVSPAKGENGRLRLVRTGGDLAYFVSEGDDEQFKLLDTFPLGTDDLKDVRVVASTGGESASINVRVHDLRIRAETLLRPPPKVSAEIVLPKAEYAQEYYHSFKGNPAKPPGWDYHGPYNAESVRFERDGLRINLPAGWNGERPGTGVQSAFGVKGDFEITMGFEFLKGPAPADVGENSTRLSLAIVKDTMYKGSAHTEVATLSRSVVSKGGPLVVAWMQVRNAADNDDVRSVKVSPAAAKMGRLRLVRSGPDLYFLNADGADDKFKVVGKFLFGAQDLWRIELVGSTGGDKASLDSRITDIHIRAHALPNAPPTGPPPETGAVGPGAAPPVDERGWTLTTLWIGAGVAAVLVAAGGVVWWRRRRARAAVVANAPAANHVAPAFVSLTCAGCSKKFRAKESLAGKKIKCPQCGKLALVPAAQELKSPDPNE
jgi:hypothetical protein